MTFFTLGFEYWQPLSKDEIKPGVIKRSTMALLTKTKGCSEKLLAKTNTQGFLCKLAWFLKYQWYNVVWKRQLVQRLTVSNCACLIHSLFIYQWINWVNKLLGAYACQALILDVVNIMRLNLYPQASQKSKEKTWNIIILQCIYYLA